MSRTSARLEVDVSVKHTLAVASVVFGGGLLACVGAVAGLTADRGRRRRAGLTPATRQPRMSRCADLGCCEDAPCAGVGRSGAGSNAGCARPARPMARVIDLPEASARGRRHLG